ncbi:MAG TPA: GTPase Era [Acidimicrobiales bacterium]|nr:GTPase Era [Acidimicrobiales bacterium]
MRSGFVTLVGRPNVGKSTLLNQILGTKASITSDKAQTTRHAVRGVLHLDAADAVTGEDTQIVFVDTPGIHKPRTPLGEHLNATATAEIADVDVACLVIDATAPMGRGDRFVAERLPADAIVVVNKCDIAKRGQIVSQLSEAGSLDADAYFPVSAVTGAGVAELVDALVRRMPEGPPYYPRDQVTDVADATWVAELVREQLLAVLREEVPHSIATRVTEWDGKRIRCEILVERESQKGIVIGHGGSVIAEVGTRTRAQLDDDVYLELFVKVDKNWQRHPERFDRLGL